MYSIEVKILKNPLAHYVAFIVVYLVLTLELPTNHTAMRSYGLTPLRYHLLFLLVALPFVGIWFAAFYGYVRLRKYAVAIGGAQESRDFQLLATGSGWLAYGLPIAALSSITLNSIANQVAHFHPLAVIINNYISLVLPLVAFTILGTSARRLASRSQAQLSLGAGRCLVLIFALLGVFYCYFTFRHLSGLSLTAIDNPYFLPVWLVVVSIVIPYLYAWSIGLLAAYEIVLFAKKSQGVLYTQALRYLGFGIATVIVSSVALQYLSSIIPRSGSSHLGYYLLCIFTIELLSAGGYGLIAQGALRLRRIEEV